MKLGPRRLGREDGQEHVTPVVVTVMCLFCGNQIGVRAEGRPRMFCDSTCRAAAYRRSRSRRGGPGDSGK